MIATYIVFNSDTRTIDTIFSSPVNSATFIAEVGLNTPFWDAAGRLGCVGPTENENIDALISYYKIEILRLNNKIFELEQFKKI